MEETKELHCGLIMPIAPIFDYTVEHWTEVKNIIIQAVNLIDNLKFKTDIVSNSDGEIDVIHKRIIQNLYNADIVVCDISGKNPNVLFELGMRLTFDKPTIIIKDDKTDFIFDTGLIEHITYPKDLRFNKIIVFQQELANAILQTYNKAKSDSTFSTFLGNFGEFRVPAINQTTISDVNQLILDELSNIRREINSIKKKANNESHSKLDSVTNNIENIAELAELFDRYLKLRPEFDSNNSEHLSNLRSFMRSNEISLNNLNGNYLNRLIKHYNREGNLSLI